MINQLNALAKRLPRAVFKVQGTLDRVTYVYVSEDVVIYVGEGYPERATKRLEEQGVNSDDFDYVIANCGCEVYLAASNITKAVAVEFEDILCREFNPPFNEKPTSSIWRTLPEGPDTFSAMRSAEKKGDYQFPTPRDTHVAEWKRCRNDEIHLIGSLLERVYVGRTIKTHWSKCITTIILRSGRQQRSLSIGAEMKS